MINKVKKMIIHSLNPDQTVNHNFLCEESFHEDYHKMTVITKSNQTGQSQLTSYYNGNGQVVRSVDSSISSIDISSYFYDSTGKIKEIKFKSSSGNRSDQSNFSEDHIYTYDTGGKLLMMYRIENNSPFSKVKFICDSAGQVIEEKEIISGKARPSIFY
ncbi:MAG TPA: hypothetical protein VNE41_08350, partial [Chitinophagaceae bacterium]|nr:hypothetical protein [Chitinophagaceae bacterium]